MQADSFVALLLQINIHEDSTLGLCGSSIALVAAAMTLPGSAALFYCRLPKIVPVQILYQTNKQSRLLC